MESNIFNRLLSEYKLHGKLVIAYDYDNTVFDYHNQGHSYEMVIDLIRRCREKGFELIVFTGSATSRFGEIKEYLDSHNIPFDRINENPSFFKSDSRKIFFNIILDDRAGLPTAYNVLKRLLDLIDKPKETSIPKEQWGVHNAHCCVEHGCKYGYDDCPVELGLSDGISCNEEHSC